MRERGRRGGRGGGGGAADLSALIELCSQILLMWLQVDGLHLGQGPGHSCFLNCLQMPMQLPHGLHRRILQWPFRFILHSGTHRPGQIPTACQGVFCG